MHILGFLSELLIKLKCLWTENCFSLVLKFALKNTCFQSLRSLGVKLTILQAFKFVRFYPQKWYLNRAAKIPRDINFWRHFSATIVLAIWRTRKKRGSKGGIALLVHQTNKAAFGIAGHVFYHILLLANKELWQRK